MRIAYDISQTGKDKAGCGYFAYSLIRALSNVDLQNEYLLLNSFGGFIWDRKATPAACGIQRSNVRLGLSHANRLAARRFWHNPPPDVDAALGNPDIVHSNNFFCPTGLQRAHLIYTLYDLSFIEHPEWTTELNRTLCFDGVYHASLYANTILAISEYSRAHFLRTFPRYPPENVRVVYPASRYTYFAGLKRPSLSKLPRRVGEGKFWLCVGTLEPRKNHVGLLRAYARHKARFGKAIPLVHAGGPGWLMNDFKDQIRKLNLQDDVILLGYVDDLPVLEAMSLGTAVIASNTTSIPEIVGGAGILVDPSQVDQIASAMDELAGDEKRLIELRFAARQRAALFSWQRAARETINLYSRK